MELIYFFVLGCPVCVSFIVLILSYWFVLCQDLNEKTIDLHTVTSNATNMETALRNENNTASTMVTTLKDELEKRLKDIMNLREERDTLQVSCSFFVDFRRLLFVVSVLEVLLYFVCFCCFIELRPLNN